MDNSQQHPIYTEKNECQDCCRCVRMCPVKAIKIENGSANIIPQLCIACGRCTKVCPFNAKRVRSDIGRAKQLLKDPAPVYVSIAPSFRTEFADIPENKLIAALRRLGFAGVSETALGAQEVSASVAELLKRDPTPRVYISSACPVVVDLIGKYIPSMAASITDFCSPAQAHARLLKKHYGDHIRVVFIGPCIGKKVEADEHPELLTLALSYNNLREWFQSESIDPLAMQPTERDVFCPDRAAEGALYPVDGGMIAGIKANCSIHDADFMAFSGVNNVVSALHDLDKTHLKRPLFLELLACEGGCVNGPIGHDTEATIIKRQQIVNAVDYDPAVVPRQARVDATLTHPKTPVLKREFSAKEINDALLSIGKQSFEDELNCSGCGYNSCRDFAVALLEGKAEPSMCVSYMRKLANKKANTLIQTMPSGVIIVQENMNVVECNRRFAEMLGDDIKDAFEVSPGLEGASAQKLVPFLTKYFDQVLETGCDISYRDIENNGSVYNVTIFTIEPHRIVGCIMRDITEPAVEKEQVIRKAQEVIRRQMETVQKIAYLLGENAAESQVSLNDIIDSYSSKRLAGRDNADSRR
ncbi:[Fe-Fe] hydrogenase large subunit C-terminal domain-containing protein [Oligosphaera ethanolica]|uniref:Iron only hydrogenase large subunit-like protein/uncharacterized Fe-S cluster-containing protein n=1 Tax=Oligosphaera ethanolica TaxID=760260 RepID=A0AAE3VJL9_9BACT|nr:[Fe-Fe] hydrogenase large subunit C-terminal domain-containing protein [Oligosphaera ethanolica]MDQ0291526.1 iron only hydrogenase large subunit-like protein/uncharacterized Fe-S cluster-containing protein [Oligosphaera ethanolica]